MLYNEIRRQIALYLDLPNCYNLFLVNKDWSKLSTDERFWQQRYRIDYELVSNSNYSQPYIQTYIQTYSQLYSQNSIERYSQRYKSEILTERQMDKMLRSNLSKLSYVRQWTSLSAPGIHMILPGSIYQTQNWSEIFKIIRRSQLNHKYHILSILKFMITHRPYTFKTMFRFKDSSVYINIYFDNIPTVSLGRIFDLDKIISKLQ